jgi:PAS domain S-box-containing protein
MTAKLSYNDLIRYVQELEKKIDTRQNTEPVVKKQPEFLNLVLESLSHPFYVIDVNNYSVTLANSAARTEHTTGLSTCYALTHKRDVPCDSAEHPCPLEIIKRTQKPCVVEHIHFDKDDRPRNVEVHAYPVFDDNGEISQMIEYTFDITDRKRIEKALKDSEMKFRTVTESAVDAIITSDRSGNIVFWNPSAEKMFEYPQNEVIGRPLTILMPESFQAAHLNGMAKHVAGGESRIIDKTVELVGLTKDGTEFPIELSISSWHAGNELFFTGIVRDITVRKQIEKERDQLIKDLQRSLAEVKTLSGMLPICSSCKKIRDDKGYWNQIEAYIHEHSDATFSHGICPDCTQKLYPDYFEK